MCSCFWSLDMTRWQIYINHFLVSFVFVCTCLTTFHDSLPHSLSSPLPPTSFPVLTGGFQGLLPSMLLMQPLGRCLEQPRVSTSWWRYGTLHLHYRHVHCCCCSFYGSNVRTVCVIIQHHGVWFLYTYLCVWLCTMCVYMCLSILCLCVSVHPSTQAEEKVVHHEVSQNIPPLFSSIYLTSPTSTSEGCIPMATESPTTYPPSGRIITHPHLLSDTVQDVMITRAFLIIRIVELKIGRDQLHQVSWGVVQSSFLSSQNLLSSFPRPLACKFVM